MSQTEKDLSLCSCYDLFANYINQVNDLVNNLSLDSDQKSDLKSKIQLLKQISTIQSVSKSSMYEESRLLIAILKNTNEIVFDKLLEELSFLPQLILDKYEEREMFAFILKTEAEVLASKNLNEILRKLFLERSGNVVLEKKLDPPKQISKPKEIAEIDDYEESIPKKNKKKSSEMIYISATKNKNISTKNKRTSVKKTSKVKDRLRSLIQKKKSFCICDPQFLQGTPDLPNDIKRVSFNVSIEQLMIMINDQIKFIDKKPDILVSEHVDVIKIIFDKRVSKKKEASCIRKIA